MVSLTKRTRRQHVVSKFYLKGFADASSQLRRVVLPGATTHLTSIDNATVIKDFYSFEGPDGELSDLLEKKFADLEGPASQALRALISDTRPGLDPSDKRELATWVALQYLRSESVRTSQTEVSAQMIRLLVGTSGKEALRNHIESSEHATVASDRLDAEWRDLTQETGTVITADPRHHLRTILELLGPTSNMLNNMQWSISAFERKVLFTGDHPVSMIVGPDYPEWQGVGLATAEGFAIPLTRRHGLVIGASPGRPDMKVHGTAALAKSVNGNTLWNARRAIYHHPEDAAALAIFDLPDPRVTEMRPFGQRMVREEGMFAGLSPQDLAPLRPSSPAQDPDGGMTLGDLPWPIPGRQFEWDA